MMSKVCGCAWLASFLALLLPLGARAQTLDPQGFLRDYSKGPRTFPSILAPYREQSTPALVLQNSPRLHDLIHNGELDLSLSDALALTLENNLNIAVERYAKPIAEAGVLRAAAGQNLLSGSVPATGGGVSVTPSGAFDPNVTFAFSWDRIKSPLNNIVVSGTPSSVSYATAFTATYSQLFPTGTNYSFSLSDTRSSSNNTSLYNPSVASNFTLGVDQPLLNGFGKLPYLHNIMIAENSNRIAEEAFRLQVVTSVVAVEDAYWSMAAAVESVTVAEQALAVDQKLLEDNKRQLEVGTLAQLDVVTAESEVASGERDLIVAQTNLQLTETKLKNMLAKRMDSELDSAHLVITDHMPEPRDADVPNLQDALANALRNRPEVRESEGNLQNQRITEQYSDLSLLPNGNVFGLLAGKGLQGDSLVGGQVVPGGTGGSLSQTFDLTYPEYSGGVNVSVPIRNRAAQANDITAKLSSAQLAVTLLSTQNSAELDVRNAIIGLVQGKSQVEAAHEAVRLENESLDAEQKKLQAGVSTPYNVILVERDLNTAQQAEVQAIVNYANALVEMDRSMGTTLDRNGIVLQQAESGTVGKMPTPPFSVLGFPPAGQGSR